MIRWMLRQRYHIGRLFQVVRGNARVIVVTEGIAAVPFQWYNTYLPLYMLSLGVSEVQVGLLASVLIFAQIISTVVGGHFADRFGRKRVLVVGDIICWGVPMLLYAVARNPWYFLVGRLINGFVYVVGPSFECLFVEDVPSEHRSAVFGSFQFLTSAARLLAPVAGYLVAQMGMVQAGRLIMFSNMAFLMGIAILRQFTLHETSVGEERMSAVVGARPLVLAREYLGAVRTMMADKPVRAFLVVRILVAFSATIWVTYFAIYLTDQCGIGLPKSFIAVIPLVSALVTMGMIMLATERLRVERGYSNLIIGQVLWLATALCLVLSPPGTIWFVMIGAVIGAISTALFQPASQSYWANIVGDQERALVFSAGSALMALFTLPAGPLAGVLYTIFPRGPFLLAMVLQIIALGLILKLRLGEKQTPNF